MLERAFMIWAVLVIREVTLIKQSKKTVIIKGTLHVLHLIRRA